MESKKVECLQCHKKLDGSVKNTIVSCSKCNLQFFLDAEGNLDLVQDVTKPGKRVPAPNQVEEVTQTAETEQVQTQENVIFSAFSFIYLVALAVCFLLIDDGLWYATQITNAYIIIAIAGLAAQRRNETTIPSMPTSLAVFSWFILNTYLVITDFPAAILTRTLWLFAHLLIGTIIGSLLKRE